MEGLNDRKIEDVVGFCKMYSSAENIPSLLDRDNLDKTPCHLIFDTDTLVFSHFFSYTCSLE